MKLCFIQVMERQNWEILKSLIIFQCCWNETCNIQQWRNWWYMNKDSQPDKTFMVNNLKHIELHTSAYLCQDEVWWWMIRLYLLGFNKRRCHQWKMVSIVFQCFHCVTKLGKIMTLRHNMIMSIILLTFSPLLSFQLPITTPKSLKSSFTEAVSSIEAQNQNTHHSPLGTRKSSLLDSTTPSSHMLTLMVGI